MMATLNNIIQLTNCSSSLTTRVINPLPAPQHHGMALPFGRGFYKALNSLKEVTVESNSSSKKKKAVHEELEDKMYFFTIINHT